MDVYILNRDFTCEGKSFEGVFDTLEKAQAVANKWTYYQNGNEGFDTWEDENWLWEITKAPVQ